MTRQRKPRYVKPPKGHRKLTLKEARGVASPKWPGSKQDKRHAKSVIARHKYERKKRVKRFLKYLRSR